jgi:hypothetical protein
MHAQTRAERRAQYFSKAKQSSVAAAGRVAREAQARQLAEREERKRSYGNAIRDISRDASRRGITSNKPLKVNTGGYVISTAPQTQPLTREQLLREYY